MDMCNCCTSSHQDIPLLTDLNCTGSIDELLTDDIIAGLGETSLNWFDELTESYLADRREVVRGSDTPVEDLVGWSPCPRGGLFTFQGGSRRADPVTPLTALLSLSDSSMGLQVDRSKRLEFLCAGQPDIKWTSAMATPVRPGTTSASPGMSAEGDTSSTVTASLCAVTRKAFHRKLFSPVGASACDDSLTQILDGCGDEDVTVESERTIVNEDDFESTLVSSLATPPGCCDGGNDAFKHSTPVASGVDFVAGEGGFRSRKENTFQQESMEGPACSGNATDVDDEYFAESFCLSAADLDVLEDQCMSGGEAGSDLSAPAVNDSSVCVDKPRGKQMEDSVLLRKRSKMSTRLASKSHIELVLSEIFPSPGSPRCVVGGGLNLDVSEKQNVGAGKVDNCGSADQEGGIFKTDLCRVDHCVSEGQEGRILNTDLHSSGEHMGRTELDLGVYPFHGKEIFEELKAGNPVDGKLMITAGDQWSCQDKEAEIMGLDLCRQQATNTLNVDATEEKIMPTNKNSWKQRTNLGVIGTFSSRCVNGTASVKQSDTTCDHSLLLEAEFLVEDRQNKQELDNTETQTNRISRKRRRVDEGESGKIGLPSGDMPGGEIFGMFNSQQSITKECNIQQNCHESSSYVESFKNSVESPVILGSSSCVESLKNSVKSPVILRSSSCVESFKNSVESPVILGSSSCVESLKNSVKSPVILRSSSCVESFKNSVESPVILRSILKHSEKRKVAVRKRVKFNLEMNSSQRSVRRTPKCLKYGDEGSHAPILDTGICAESSAGVVDFCEQKCQDVLPVSGSNDVTVRNDTCLTLSDMSLNCTDDSSCLSDLSMSVPEKDCCSVTDNQNDSQNDYLTSSQIEEDALRDDYVECPYVQCSQAGESSSQTLLHGVSSLQSADSQRTEPMLVDENVDKFGFDDSFQVSPTFCSQVLRCSQTAGHEQLPTPAALGVADINSLGVNIEHSCQVTNDRPGVCSHDVCSVNDDLYTGHNPDLSRVNDVHLVNNVHSVRDVHSVGDVHLVNDVHSVRDVSSVGDVRSVETRGIDVCMNREKVSDSKVEVGRHSVDVSDFSLDDGDDEVMCAAALQAERADDILQFSSVEMLCKQGELDVSASKDIAEDFCGELDYSGKDDVGEKCHGDLDVSVKDDVGEKCHGDLDVSVKEDVSEDFYGVLGVSGGKDVVRENFHDGLGVSGGKESAGENSLCEVFAYSVILPVAATTTVVLPTASHSTAAASLASSSQVGVAVTSTLLTASCAVPVILASAVLSASSLSTPPPQSANAAASPAVITPMPSASVAPSASFTFTSLCASASAGSSLTSPSISASTAPSVSATSSASTIPLVSRTSSVCASLSASTSSVFATTLTCTTSSVVTSSASTTTSTCTPLSASTSSASTSTSTSSTLSKSMPSTLTASSTSVMPSASTVPSTTAKPPVNNSSSPNDQPSLHPFRRKQRKFLYPNLQQTTHETFIIEATTANSVAGRTSLSAQELVGGSLRRGTRMNPSQGMSEDSTHPASRFSQQGVRCDGAAGKMAGHSAGVVTAGKMAGQSAGVVAAGKMAGQSARGGAAGKMAGQFAVGGAAGKMAGQSAEGGDTGSIARQSAGGVAAGKMAGQSAGDVAAGKVAGQSAGVVTAGKMGEKSAGGGAADIGPPRKTGQLLGFAKFSDVFQMSNDKPSSCTSLTSDTFLPPMGRAVTVANNDNQSKAGDESCMSSNEKPCDVNMRRVSRQLIMDSPSQHAENLECLLHGRTSPPDNSRHLKQMVVQISASCGLASELDLASRVNVFEQNAPGNSVCDKSAASSAGSSSSRKDDEDIDLTSQMWSQTEFSQMQIMESGNGTDGWDSDDSVLGHVQCLGGDPRVDSSSRDPLVDSSSWTEVIHSQTNKSLCSAPSVHLAEPDETEQFSHGTINNGHLSGSHTPQAVMKHSDLSIIHPGEANLEGHLDDIFRGLKHQLKCRKPFVVPFLSKKNSSKSLSTCSRKFSGKSQHKVDKFDDYLTVMSFDVCTKDESLSDLGDNSISSAVEMNNVPGVKPERVDTPKENVRVSSAFETIGICSETSMIKPKPCLNSGTRGFSTASGRAICVSESARNQAWKLMQDSVASSELDALKDVINGECRDECVDPAGAGASSLCVTPVQESSSRYEFEKNTDVAKAERCTVSDSSLKRDRTQIAGYSIVDSVSASNLLPASSRLHMTSASSPLTSAALSLTSATLPLMSAGLFATSRSNCMPDLTDLKRRNMLSKLSIDPILPNIPIVSVGALSSPGVLPTDIVSPGVANDHRGNQGVPRLDKSYKGFRPFKQPKLLNGSNKSMQGNVKLKVNLTEGLNQINGEKSKNLLDNGEKFKNLLDNGEMSKNLLDNGEMSKNLLDNGEMSKNLLDNGEMSKNLLDNGEKSKNLLDNGEKSKNLLDNGEKSKNLLDNGEKFKNLLDNGEKSKNLLDNGEKSKNLLDNILDITWKRQDSESADVDDWEDDSSIRELILVDGATACGASDDEVHGSRVDVCDAGDVVRNTSFSCVDSPRLKPAGDADTALGTAAKGCDAVFLEEGDESSSMLPQSQDGHAGPLLHSFMYGQKQLDQDKTQMQLPDRHDNFTAPHSFSSGHQGGQLQSPIPVQQRQNKNSLDFVGSSCLTDNKSQKDVENWVDNGNSYTGLMKGFVTARGGRVSVSETALLQARKMLTSEESEKNMSGFCAFEGKMSSEKRMTNEPQKSVMHQGIRQPGGIRLTRKGVDAQVKSAGNSLSVRSNCRGDSDTDIRGNQQPDSSTSAGVKVTGKLESEVSVKTDANGSLVKMSSVHEREVSQSHNTGTTAGQSGRLEDETAIEHPSIGSAYKQRCVSDVNCRPSQNSSASVQHGLEDPSSEALLGRPACTENPSLGALLGRPACTEDPSLEALLGRPACTEDPSLGALLGRPACTEDPSLGALLGRPACTENPSLGALLGRPACTEDPSLEALLGRPACTEVEIPLENVNSTLQEEELKSGNTTKPSHMESGIFATSGLDIPISKTDFKNATSCVNETGNTRNKTRSPVVLFDVSPAGGVQVSVTGHSVKKAENLLEQFGVVDGMKEGENNVSTATSGPVISVSQTALVCAGIVSDEGGVDDVKDVRPAFSAGFTTASGSKVSVSETALQHARSSFGDVDDVKDVMPAFSAGFTTASGSKVYVCEKALQHARRSFGDVDEDKDVMPAFSAGFTTASGSKVYVCEKALQHARSSFGDAGDADEVKDVMPAFSAGFTTASGSKVYVCEKALQHAKSFLTDSEQTFESSTQKPENLPRATSSGVLQDSGEFLQGKEMFNSKTCDSELTAVSPRTSLRTHGKLSRNMNKYSSTLHQVKENAGNSSQNLTSGFSTAGGSRIYVTEEALRGARDVLDSAEDSVNSVKAGASNSFKVPSKSLHNLDPSVKAVPSAISHANSLSCREFVEGLVSAAGSSVLSEQAMSEVHSLLVDENGNSTEVISNSNNMNNLDGLTSNLYQTTPACVTRNLPSRGVGPDHESRHQNHLSSEQTQEKIAPGCGPAPHVSTEPTVTSDRRWSQKKDLQTPLRAACESFLFDRRRTKGRLLSAALSKPVDSLAGMTVPPAPAVSKFQPPYKKTKMCDDDSSYSCTTTSNSGIITRSSSSHSGTSTGSTTSTSSCMPPVKLSKGMCHKSTPGTCDRPKHDLSHKKASVEPTGGTLNKQFLGQGYSSGRDFSRGQSLCQGYSSGRDHSSREESGRSESLKELSNPADSSPGAVLASPCSFGGHQPKASSDNASHSDTGHHRHTSLDLMLDESRMKQDGIIRNKQRGTVRPVCGRWLEFRKRKEAQKTLKSLGLVPETGLSREQLLSHGLSDSCLQVSSLNAGGFRFDLRRFYPCLDACVLVGDGALLVPDRHVFCGALEFHRALLTLDGVDPKLVDESWVRNHYRWIVWKLAAYEVCFPHVFAGRSLTPEIVMLQLKYRYDREIDLCHRSAIKKIVERDDTPCKRLVLCVASVKQTINGQFSLELTDGWYSIPGQLDDCLTQLISRKRIRPGDKIVTSGAELLGCADGCSPLELKEGTMLKLYGNSTRPAPWYSRLGYCFPPTALCVPLRSLSPHGGLASRLDVVFCRRYPVMYMEKLADGSSIFRTAEEEDKARQRHEDRFQMEGEKMYMSLQKEMEKNTRACRPGRGRTCQKDVQSLWSGQDLASAVENSLNPEELQQSLSCSQMERLIKYQQAEVDRRQQEINRKLQEVMAEACKPRQVTSVVKFKVRGCCRSDVDSSSSCHLVVWRPGSEWMEVEEGKRYQLFNVSVAPARGRSEHGKVGLTATRQTRFQACHISTNLLDIVYSQRNAWTVSELRSGRPFEDEFDFVGVVIQVVAPTRSTGPTCVFAADKNREILCIRVWTTSLIASLQPGQCFVASDLILSRSLQYSVSRSGLVSADTRSDVTSFSTSARCARRYSDLFSQVHTISKTKGFLSDLQTKLQDRGYSTDNRHQTPGHWMSRPQDNHEDFPPEILDRIFTPLSQEAAETGRQTTLVDLWQQQPLGNQQSVTVSGESHQSSDSRSRCSSFVGTAGTNSQLSKQNVGDGQFTVSKVRHVPGKSNQDVHSEKNKSSKRKLEEEIEHPHSVDIMSKRKCILRTKMSKLLAYERPSKLPPLPCGNSPASGREFKSPIAKKL